MRILVLLVVVLVGCGGSSNVHHLADGGADAPRSGADASIDAPGSGSGSGSASGLVSVAVTLQSQPQSGIQVYFQNADSTVVASTTTDGSGNAAATMAAGGFVTVVEPQGEFIGTTEVTTFAGVQPGDQLHDDYQPSPAFHDDTIEISVPVDPNPNVNFYRLLTTCDASETVLNPPDGSGETTTPPTQISLECGDGSADMIVEALDEDSPAIIDYLFAPAVAVGGGGAVTLSGSYATVPTTTVEFSDVPPLDGGVVIDETLFTAQGELFEGFVTSFDGSGSGSVSFSTIATGAGLSEALGYELTQGSGGFVDSQTVEQWGPVVTTTVDVDLGSAVLSDWTNVPQVDAGSNAVDWTVAGDGQAPAYLVATVDASRVIGGDNTDWIWSIATPGSEDGAIAFPLLPGTGSAFDFQPGDSTIVQELVGETSPGGYDAVRAEVFNVAGVPGDQPEQILFSSGSGQATVEVYQQEDRPRSRAHHHRATRVHRSNR